MSFQASHSSATSSLDNLVAGNADLLFAIPIIVLSGQVLSRGSVLGKVTASSKFVLSLSAAADGSQTPAGVLADDVDATGGDKAGLLYVRGDFNDAALILGTGHTLTSVAAALRDLGVFIVAQQGGV